MLRLLPLFVLLLISYSCKQKIATSKDPIPKHQSLKLYSDILNEERVINIWTPPTYDSVKQRLPVLYMPDGGVKEDFPHIANTLARLIESNKIPPFILVGIENTERGRDLTGESQIKEHEEYGIPMEDGAKDFRAFIQKELIPRIESTYRCTEKRGIIGESLAGLFIMETFFLQPQLFNYYIAMDPSFWWNDNVLVKHAEEHLQNLPERETRLWFAGSNTVDIKEYTDQLGEFLAKRETKNLNWHYSPEPKEKHHTIYRACKKKALIWTLGSKEGIQNR